MQLAIGERERDSRRDRQAEQRQAFVEALAGLPGRGLHLQERSMIGSYLSDC
jgi:hypothetical protein